MTIKDMLPPSIYCTLINARNRLRGKKHKIYPGAETGIYRVTDGENELFICRRDRHNRSKRGIIAGVTSLAKQYHLDKISISSGDLLIDCGANIGELGVWARNNNLLYVAIEPEMLEARCVDLNAFGGEEKTFRIALWFEETVLKFFSKPSTADSSAIEIDNFDGVKNVQAKRLDSIMSDFTTTGKIILKIEAEGAEPEVLAGAKELLQRVDYITIDCGFERGKNKDHTFVETNNVLVDNGFRVIDANFSRMTMLYQKR